MQPIKIFIFLIGSFIMTENLQAQALDATPAFVAETFVKHACWQSGVFMSMPGVITNIVSKKWMIQKSNAGLVLNELSAASIIMTSENEGHWGSTSFNVQKGPSVLDVANFPINIPLVFSKDNGGRLVASFDMGFPISVIFFPVSCSQDAPATYKGDIGFAETPFGLNPPPFPYGSTEKTQYIHHRKNSTVAVHLDESFPDLFVVTVTRALAKWNQALGWDVYQLAPGRQKLDPIDCLVSRSLCLFWQGRTDKLGWIGWGGLTGINFDPITGEIIGGTIHFSNMAESDLQDTPTSVLEEMSRNFNLDLVAKMLLKKEEFRHYSHPYPQQLFESLLLHEMGHANGLKHDFRGSLGGSPAHPSNTLMEYLPFPVVHNLTYVGSKDTERLKVVYKNVTPQKSLKTCSDDNAAKGFDPSCLQNDLGDPAQWYMRLANLGDKSVFTVVRENQTGLPIRYYIDMLGKFVDNPFVPLQQSKTVTDYLCRLNNKTEVQNYVETQLKKTFSCAQ